MSDPARPAGDSAQYADDLAGGDHQREARRRARADWPVVVYRMGEEPPDWEYWLSRPPGERSAGIESLRAQHHGWTHETRPQLQRVLRVVQVS